MAGEIERFERRRRRMLVGFTVAWALGTVAFLACIVWPELAGERRQKYELAKAAFESIAAYGVLFTLLFSSYNQLQAVLQRKEQDRQRRAERQVEYSFRLIDRLDRPSQNPARDAIRRYYKTPLDPACQQAFSGQLHADDAITRSFVARLNLYGRIAHAIDEGMADERVLKESLNNTFGRTYLLAQPWMAEQIPALERDLKKLYERWGSYRP